MRNQTFTITLPVATIDQLTEQAALSSTTPGLLAAQILNEQFERPEWRDVTIAAAAREIVSDNQRLRAERDRARLTAMRMWAELRDELGTEAVRRAPLVTQQLVLYTGDVLDIVIAIVVEYTDRLRTRSKTSQRSDGG